MYCVLPLLVKSNTFKYQKLEQTTNDLFDETVVSTCSKAADAVQSQGAALKCGVLLWLHQRLSASVTHCCYLYRSLDSVFGSRTATLAGSYSTGSHGTDSLADF